MEENVDVKNNNNLDTIINAQVYYTKGQKTEPANILTIGI